LDVYILLNLGVLKMGENAATALTGAALPTGEMAGHSFFQMVSGSGPVVFSVLLILIALSIISWTITIAKYFQFRRARQESAEFSELFWQSRIFSRIEDSAARLESSPLAQVFRAGYREFVQRSQRSAGAAVGAPRRTVGAEFSEAETDTIERTMKRAEAAEGAKLEQGLTFLANVATSAPFIGLFGTVWGIMNAFHGLQFAKSTSIQAVAPGISEALIATAIGLAAAIPASIAFNYGVVATREMRESMERFTREFLSLTKQQNS
jgi:biopolymer transport protein TolQ